MNRHVAEWGRDRWYFWHDQSEGVKKMGDPLKDVADAMGASVKALDAEAARPGFFHSLILKAGAALVGVVELAARGAILAAVPIAWQKDALAAESMLEGWAASKLAGKPITFTHDSVVLLHAAVSDAADSAIASFVAPRLGATGTEIVSKVAHAIEDAAAGALPQDGPKL